MATLDKDLLAIQEMRDAVKHANTAQAAYMQFSQQQVDNIVKVVADAAFKEADRLAKWLCKKQEWVFLTIKR